MSVFVAPPCRLELAATTRLAYLHNVTVVTGGGDLFTNLDLYPYLIRTSYSPVLIWDIFVEIAKNNSWDTFFVLYDASSNGMRDEKFTYAIGLTRALRNLGSGLF